MHARSKFTPCQTRVHWAIFVVLNSLLLEILTDLNSCLCQSLFKLTQVSIFIFILHIMIMTWATFCSSLPVPYPQLPHSPIKRVIMLISGFEWPLIPRKFFILKHLFVQNPEGNLVPKYTLFSGILGNPDKKLWKVTTQWLHYNTIIS